MWQPCGPDNVSTLNVIYVTNEGEEKEEERENATDQSYATVHS